MKLRLLTMLALTGAVGMVHAQTKVGTITSTSVIYKCGNEYTNTPTEAQRKSCQVLTGGNVTVVQSSRPAPGRVASSPALAGIRVDSGAQRERDKDARAILEAELKKTEAHLADLNQQYGNGQPDKQGDESRNYQKYLDRVAQLKADIDRTTSDIDGIKRELARMPQ